MSIVAIRPLTVSDAQISWRWRNDPDVWFYTGSKPDRVITPELEVSWIESALKRSDERRFAICLGEEGRYIGNCQLTGIDSIVAELHIFIGETIYHHLGIGTQAIRLVLEYAREELKLQRIHLMVHKENRSAIAAYQKCGFRLLADCNGKLKMEKELKESDV